MNDFDRREERRRYREERRQQLRERWEKAGYRGYYAGNVRGGSVWTGLFLLLIGVAALIKATVTDLPDWMFSWQMFLIVLGFFVGIRHGFRGGIWLILMLIGGVFLFRDLYPELALRRYTWPFVLIIMGIFLIFRPRRRWHTAGIEKKNGAPDEPASLKNEKYTSEDFVDSTSVFGGAKKNIISKNFKGGDIVNIFGGTELNLTQADFSGTAEIELTIIFGGTKLIVPPNWSIKSEAVTIFGGMEDKRNLPVSTENSDKLLVLKGTVMFGGIDIRSF
jgi:predicted membrane protein